MSVTVFKIHQWLKSSTIITDYRPSSSHSYCIPAACLVTTHKPIGVCSSGGFFLSQWGISKFPRGPFRLDHLLNITALNPTISISHESTCARRSPVCTARDGRVLAGGGKEGLMDGLLLTSDFGFSVWPIQQLHCCEKTAVAAEHLRKVGVRLVCGSSRCQGATAGGFRSEIKRRITKICLSCL